ncbi:MULTISPECIES: LOG family protein [unclassified Nocardia]|uniref:SLOG cluster 4 domain-containing protein n=1 Tax=unclassified Nocardia TaxID=2637762 RepID=UPI0024A86FD0|nr:MULTISPECIES: LOG family protein [unclassified Nocardia]
MPSIQVAVCGPRDCTPTDVDNAREIGRLLAEAGATVLCGGGTGVMAAVAEGASRAGGLVIGVRPDNDREQVCDGLSAVLYTNMGEARNAVIVWSADAVIVVGGSWGTLSEVALARRRGGVPVVGIGGWRVHDADGRPLDAGIEVRTPTAAVATALSCLPPSVSGADGDAAGGVG